MTNITKIHKFSSFKPQESLSAYSTSVKQVSDKTQTLKSKIVVVEAIANDGDVIFTTVQGKRLEISNNLKASIGDKVRVAKDSEGEYRVISIYEKSYQLLERAVDLGESATIFESRGVRIGENLVGRFISFAGGSEFTGDETAKTLIGRFSGNRDYQFKVLSINNNLGFAELQTGLVGTLNEILSSEEEGQNNFPCKVVNFEHSRAVVNSKYGNILFDRVYSNMVPGTDLIIQLIPDGRDAEELETNDIDDLISKLDLVRLFLRNKIEEFNRNPLELLTILALLKKFCYKGGDSKLTKANRLLLERLRVEESSEDEREDFRRAFTEIKEQIDKIYYKEFHNSGEKIGWFLFEIELNEDIQKRKQQVYLQKTGKSLIRMIINLNFSNIGEVQFDAIIALGLSDSEDYVKNFDLKVRYKNKMSSDFFNILRDSLHNSLSPFGVKSTVIFEETEKFSQDFLHHASYEEQSLSSMAQKTSGFEYFI